MSKLVLTKLRGARWAGAAAALLLLLLLLLIDGSQREWQSVASDHLDFTIVANPKNAARWTSVHEATVT
jgi:hypothetical protein